MRSVYDGQINHLFACDSDRHVRLMIDKNFDPEVIYNDVLTRDPFDAPYVDIYFAGFPCQTFSSAGKRDGFADDRGIVFFAIHDYIKNRLPKVCILENVQGLLHHDQGESFKTMIKMLKELGCYHVYWQLISPHNYNWPQYRPRVFIVCIRRDVSKKKFKFPEPVQLTIKASDLLELHGHKVNKNLELTDFEQKNLRIHTKKVKERHGDDLNKEFYFMDIGASPAFGSPRKDVVPCLKATRSNYYISKLRRKMTIPEIEKIQGFPPLNHEVVSDAQYRKMLGNSMCVPVVKVILKEVLKSTKI